MDITKFFIPLEKVDEEQRMVYGYASTESLDSQGEVITRKAIIDALPDYMRFANIREMHQPSAVGVAKQADMDDKGLFIGVKVVDEAAWTKVKEGVYKGFSVGGRALAKADGVITKMRLTEISLVDRPANPECVFDTFKADGVETEEVELRVPSAVAKAIETLGQEALAKILADAVSAASATPAVAKTEDKPADEGGKVEKGLWNVQRMVEALQTMRNACESCDYEAGKGEHSAELATEMKAVLGALGSVAQKYLGEELAQMLKPAGSTVVAMSEGGGDIEKAGARYSKATKAMLAKVHGMLRECDKALVEMGYESAEDDDGAMKADVVAPQPATALEAEVLDVAKAAGFELPEGALYADLMKAALAEVLKSRARIAELEKQPEPPKVAATSVPVAKTQDTNGSAAAPAQEPQQAEPLDVFKAALGRPVAFKPVR